MPLAAQTQGGGVTGESGSGSTTVPDSPPGGVPTSGAIIPDAGVYGAETAAALNAYNNAVAQAGAQRNQLYNQYGLDNSGAVDPNNPYGQYEQMLNAQGSQFQGDQADAAGRGLGRGGLANQQESQDRAAAGAQDFQFQQQANQVSSDYNQQMQAALSAEQGSNSQAYQDAMNTALQNQLNALTAGQYSAPGVGTPAPVLPKAKVAPKVKPKPKAKPPRHK
jgi:hypothetical protein